jgi:hypothetical protein
MIHLSCCALDLSQGSENELGIGMAVRTQEPVKYLIKGKEGFVLFWGSSNAQSTGTG